MESIEKRHGKQCFSTESRGISWKIAMESNAFPQKAAESHGKSHTLETTVYGGGVKSCSGGRFSLKHSVSRSHSENDGHSQK